MKILPVVRIDKCATLEPRMPEREIIARALYKRRHGNNPDRPMGVNKNGYPSEPYVKTVPGWEWFHGADADAILEALSADFC